MTYQWTTKDVVGLEQFYWSEIAPMMEADGLDPEYDGHTLAWAGGRRRWPVRIVNAA